MSMSLTLGFAFLYIPILLLVIFSFNEGKNVAIWTGWSTKWYSSVFNNAQLMDAAWVTFRVAILLGDPRHDSRHARRHHADALSATIAARRCSTAWCLRRW